MAYHEKLMPLRIPSGWAVRFNTFADVDIHADDERFMRAFFDEDLLWIVQITHETDANRVIVHSSVDGNALAIDLGWYPSGDPNGHYRAQIMYNGFEHILAQFESRERQRIVEQIEMWLLLDWTELIPKEE